MKKLLLILLLAVGMSGCASQQAGPQLPPATLDDSQPSATSAMSGFTHLSDFEDSNGAVLYSGLTAVGDNLYGTTFLGGDQKCGYQNVAGCGVIYKVSTSGKITVLHAFKSTPDGASSWAPLTNVNGTLYGTTLYGGNSSCNTSSFPPGCGTVFKISTSGKYSVLYSFSGPTSPSMAPLIFVKGALYGTTIGGYGAVYRLTLDGKEKLIYKCTGDSDQAPSGISYVDGKFYVTVAGGSQSYGQYYYGGVEKLLPGGKAKFVYTFKGSPDGAYPMGPLASINGTIYGATHGGGNTTCTGGCGTVYSLTPGGKEHILHEFDPKTEGVTPYTGVLAMGGNIYGAACCWIKGGGSIFKVTPSGKETNLHEFAAKSPDGTAPYGLPALLNGQFYGTTLSGGDDSKYIYGYGTIYKLSP